MFNKLNKTYSLILCAFFLSLKISAQNSNGFNKYLIKELDTSLLSSKEKEFLSKSISTYYNSTNDSIKLSTLKNIVEGVKEPSIWNDYNSYMFFMSDSLSQIRPNNYTQFIRSEAMYNKAYYNRIRKDYNQSTKYFEEAAIACKQAKHFRLEAKSYYLIALNYQSLSEPEKALVYFNKSLKLREKLGLIEDIGDTHYAIGNHYLNQGNHPIALENFFKSLEVREKIKDSKGISACFNRMATIYKKQNEINTAIEYYKKSLILREKEKDYKGQAVIQNNLGVIYKDLKQYNKALLYYDKSLSIKKEYSSKGSIAATLNNIGTVYFLQKKYNEALNFYQQTLELIGDNTKSKWKIICLFNIAEVYTKIKKPNLAKEYGEKSFDLAQAKKDFDLIKESSRVLKEVYRLDNNWKKALEMNELYTKLKDSVINDKTEKEAIRLKANYDLAKKEQEIELLKKEQEYQQLKLNRNKIFNILLFLGIALLSTISFFIYKMAQKNKQVNQLLIEQNKQKQLLMDETHHRVKNNLQMVNTLLRLQSAEVEEKRIVDMFKETQNRVLSVANLHERLYKVDNAEEIKLKSYLEKLIEDISNNFSFNNNITIETNINEATLETEKVIPLSLIINEALTNSFKYAFPNEEKGKVFVDFYQDNEINKLELGDDGTGFNEEETSLGLGYKLLKLFAKQLNGSIKKNKGKGTVYVITFPSN